MEIIVKIKKKEREADKTWAETKKESSAIERKEEGKTSIYARVSDVSRVKYSNQSMIVLM